MNEHECKNGELYSCRYGDWVECRHCIEIRRKEQIKNETRME